MDPGSIEKKHINQSFKFNIVEGSLCMEFSTDTYTREKKHSL